MRNRILVLILFQGALMSVSANPLSRVFPTLPAEKDLSFVMSLSEDQLADLVPRQSGIHYTNCPACRGGSQDCGNFEWRPEDPHKIRCKDCGEIFPGNAKFRDNRSLKIRSFNEVHEYPYCELRDGHRLFLRAKADDMAREYMAECCRDLARQWWATKDDKYALRAAAILVRFAEVYPGYALHYDYPFQPKVIVPPDHGPIPEANKHGGSQMRTAKWTWWAYLDISRELAEAYDILRHWPPLRTLAEGQACEIIEESLLGAMMESTMRLEETYSNMSPTKWSSAAQVARILRRPDVIHDIVDRLERFMNGQLHYDGSWYETSPSYALQVWGNLGIIDEALKTYADPLNYRHPKTGRNLTEEDIQNVLNLRNKIIQVVDQTRFPDGRLLPVNDTWAYQGMRGKRERMESLLVPGFGVAVMGGGEGVSQFHSYLNFTSGKAHNQWGTLTLGLWAFGAELLSDIGYTHTAYRSWTASTPSHNTVTVDGKNQSLDRNYTGNRLRLWASDGWGFHTVEAESRSAYPQTRRYRRALMAVGDRAEDCYMVDVFQVHGGRQHDYILAGSADEDSSMTLDVPMEPFRGNLLNRGVKFDLPRTENDMRRPETGLGLISDLWRGQTSRMVLLEGRVHSLGVRFRSWVDAGQQTAVYLGTAPSVRRAKEVESKLKDFRMPMFIARREGNNLKSEFVAVHQPFRGNVSVIQSVEVERRPDVIVVTIVRKREVDYVMIALDESVRLSVQTPFGPIEFDGQQGMIRICGGRATEAHLVAGSKLKFGDVELLSEPFFSGEIVGTKRIKKGAANGAFLVKEVLPENVNYGVLLVQLADGTTQGYNVVRVVPGSAGSHIQVHENPSFDLTKQGVETRFFPLRTVKGDAPKYRLITTAHHAKNQE